MLSSLGEEGDKAGVIGKRSNSDSNSSSSIGMA